MTKITRQRSRAGKPAGVVPASIAEEARPDGQRPGFRIVAMGGSAGGLEAFEQFFSHLPPDTGLGFVLVPHLEPTHKGMMPELLGRNTKMKVVEADDGVKVQPNCVYVIPPNADLVILHGRLHVLEPTAPRGVRMPIDFFFRQLAADQKEKAIGIILSGMGSDGTLGLKAIKENLGMAMVQEPASAKYDAMPRSAIASGLADYVAAAESLPAKLLQYVNHKPRPPEEGSPAEGKPSTAIDKVFVLLRAHTGNDFSYYKSNTIRRRIERRMSVHQLDSLPRYVRFFQDNPQEVQLLYRELLIGVTNFFPRSGAVRVPPGKGRPAVAPATAGRRPLAGVEPRLLDRRGDLLAGDRLAGVPRCDDPPAQPGDPDFRHGHRQRRGREGPVGQVPGRHRLERLARALGPLLRPRGGRLPDQEGSPRSGGIRTAEHPG